MEEFYQTFFFFLFRSFFSSSYFSLSRTQVTLVGLYFSFFPSRGQHINSPRIQPRAIPRGKKRARFTSGDALLYLLDSRRRQKESGCRVVESGRNNTQQELTPQPPPVRVEMRMVTGVEPFVTPRWSVSPQTAGKIHHIARIQGRFFKVSDFILYSTEELCCRT